MLLGLIVGVFKYKDKMDSTGTSDKETIVKSSRSKKTTESQKEMLFTFMHCRPDFPVGRLKDNEETKTILKEFDGLVTELNAIGPPVHSANEWRKIWSEFKAKGHGEHVSSLSMANFPHYEIPLFNQQKFSDEPVHSPVQTVKLSVTRLDESSGSSNSEEVIEKSDIVTMDVVQSDKSEHLLLSEILSKMDIIIHLLRKLVAEKCDIEV